MTRIQFKNSSDRKAEWKGKEWITEDVLTDALIERELANRGALPEPEPLKPLTLSEFARRFWPVLEPDTKLEWGWALDAMCLHLEAAARRNIRKLIINVPPGTMKSSLTNVFFPAWVWAELRASERFLCCSFNEDLSTRDSVAMRRLVESVEYQSRYGEKVRLMRDQNSKKQYDTTARGRRLVKSILNATGARASILIVDDPNNAVEIDSKAHRRTINGAYDNSLRMRGANQDTFVQIVIMQRLHEEDLTGHLEKKASGWEVLRLPERYEPENPTVTSIWKDPRTVRGELLFPSYRSEEAVRGLESDLGSFGAASQLQQRPVPIGGGIIKGWWWRFHAPLDLIPTLPPIVHKVYSEDGSVTHVPAVVIPTPTEFDFKATSWDAAFKDTKASDFVVGQAWGAKGANDFLLDQVHGRFSFTATLSEIVKFLGRHEDIDEHLIEDKANGPAIISTLQDHIPGLIAIDPEGSKLARLKAQSPTIESGNVYLPHPSLCPWVAALFLPEFAGFPNGAHDDQVDATSQYLNRAKAERKRRKKKDDRKGAAPPPLAGLANIGGAGQSKWRGQ